MHVAHKGEEKYRILMGIIEQKRQCGKPRRRWKEYYSGSKRTQMGGHNWKDLAQDRDKWQTVVSWVMNLMVP